MEDSLYKEHILELYKHPENFGKLEDPSVTKQGHNPLCGDKINIELKIKDDKIEDIKFNGEGCAISVASTSLLTDNVKGKTLEEVKKLDAEFVKNLLGIDVGVVRIKCAVLGLKTLQKAVEKYENVRDNKLTYKC